MKKMKIYVLVLFTALFSQFSLFANIQTVTLRWTAGQCSSSCIRGLTDQYNKLAGVSSVQMDQNAGQAILTWRPNVIFSYPQLQAATAMIGIFLQEIRMRVTGTITHDDQNFALISIGDGTTFQLLGPLTPSSSGMTIIANPATHPLPPYLQEQLLTAENNQQIVTVEGPLFEAHRSPPLYLIAGSVSVENPR